MNICAPAHAACDGSGVCQTIPSGSSFSCGAVAGYQLEDNGNGVTVKYTDGQMCQNSIPRQSSIRITCDQTVERGVIDGVVEEQVCVYTVLMRSRYAC